MRKSWTDREVISIRKDRGTMSIKEIMAKYDLTKNQVTHAIYNYDLNSQSLMQLWRWRWKKIKQQFLDE
tara:strand:- start:968 stop:1174 length:207 start_codon:yes stop_codon:yes gene_type:complete